MNFELSEELKIIQDMAAKFAKRELEPVAAELDQTKNREIHEFLRSQSKTHLGHSGWI